MSEYNYIGECIGEASMCWEKPECAGVFDSDNASRIADKLCKRVDEQLSAENKRLRELLGECVPLLHDGPSFCSLRLEMIEKIEKEIEDESV